MITSYLFTRSKSVIDFELICFPRAYGGLGLINPEKMAQAMNGKSIARMIAHSGDLGTAFKLQLIRVTADQGADIFRLLAHGNWSGGGGSPRMPFQSPPFWRRIYDTCLNLNLTLTTDWNKYTDEQILMLPYDTPLICGTFSEKFGKRIRSTLPRLRIYLLRDILIFRPTQTQKFQFRNKEEGERLLQTRLLRLYPEWAADRSYHFRPNQDTGPYGAPRKAMTDLRRFWTNDVWPNAPAEFKERLQSIRTLPPGLRPMLPGGDGNFPTDSTFDLVLWDKMTLAGVECEQYTVRQGRIEGTKAHVLQPNWEEIRGLEECNSEER
jgi:hypothetical protein